MFAYSGAGDIGTSCDWDGDGRRTVAVDRPATVSFHLRNSNTSGVADVTFANGDAGDTFLTGDWNGDGVDTARFVRNGRWLRNANSPGAADVAFGHGDPSDLARVWL